MYSVFLFVLPLFTIRNPVHDKELLAGTMCLLCLAMTKHFKLPYCKIFFYTLLFLLVITTSYIFTNQASNNYMQYINWVIGILCFVNILQMDTTKKLYFVFGISGALVALYALLYHNGINPFWKFAGYKFSWIGHKNNLGMCLIMCFPFSVYMFKFNRWLSIICSVLICAGVYVSGAKGAMIALLVTLLILAFRYRLLFIPLGIIFILLAPKVYPKVSSVLDSTDSRIYDIYPAMFNRCLESPITGVGIGNLNVNLGCPNNTGTHSLWFDLHSMGGLFSLFLFLLILYKAFKSDKDIYLKLSLLSFLIYASVASAGWIVSQVYLWTVLGMIAHRTDDTFYLRPVYRALGVGFSLFIIYLIVLPLYISNVVTVIGYGYLNSGDYIKSFECLKVATEKVPRFYKAHYGLGFVYWYCGYNDLAKEQFLIVDNLYPNFAFTRKVLGVINGNK